MKQLLFILLFIPVLIFGQDNRPGIYQISSRDATSKGQASTSDGIGNVVWKSTKTINGDSIWGVGDISISQINYTVQALSGLTPTWNASLGVNATLTISGNTTITLSNLIAGTTGTIYVTNPATLYSITVAGYTNKIVPSARAGANLLKISGSSKIDVFSWFYTGSVLVWNGANNYN